MVEPYLPKTDLAEKAERINSFIQQLRAGNKALAGRVESLEQVVAGYESKLKQAEVQAEMEKAGLRKNIWGLTNYFQEICCYLGEHARSLERVVGGIKEKLSLPGDATGQELAERLQQTINNADSYHAVNEDNLLLQKNYDTLQQEYDALQQRYNGLIKTKVFDAFQHVAEVVGKTCRYVVRKLTAPTVAISVATVITLWWCKPYLDSYVDSYLASARDRAGQSYSSSSSSTRKGGGAPKADVGISKSEHQAGKGQAPLVETIYSGVRPPAAANRGAFPAGSSAPLTGLDAILVADQQRSRKAEKIKVEPAEQPKLGGSCGSLMIKIIDLSVATKVKIGENSWRDYTCRVPTQDEVCLEAGDYTDREFAKSHQLEYGCPGNEKCCPPPKHSEPLETNGSSSSPPAARDGTEQAPAEPALAAAPPQESGQGEASPAPDGAAPSSENKPPEITEFSCSTPLQYSPQDITLPGKITATDDTGIKGCSLLYQAKGPKDSKTGTEKLNPGTGTEKKYVRQFNPAEYCKPVEIGFPCTVSFNAICFETSGKSSTPSRMLTVKITRKEDNQ